MMRDSRVEACSAIAALEAMLELAAAALPARSRFRPLLTRIRGDLLDLAADLAPPDARPPAARIEAARVEWLAAACEEARSGLAPLDVFALLRGSDAAICLARARTACRRVRRQTIVLSRHEPLNPLTLDYLEGLAELLLVLTRAVDADTGERLRPGRLAAAGRSRGAGLVRPEKPALT